MEQRRLVNNVVYRSCCYRKLTWMESSIFNLKIILLLFIVVSHYEGVAVEIKTGVEVSTSAGIYSPLLR